MYERGLMDVAADSYLVSSFDHLSKLILSHKTYGSEQGSRRQLNPKEQSPNSRLAAYGSISGPGSATTPDTSRASNNK